MFDPDKIRFAGPEEIEFPILSTEEDVEEELSQDGDQPEPLIVLPMINAVHFPGIVMPTTITREKTIQAVQRAYKENKRIAVITQKDSNAEDPGFNDLYKIGTVARILKLLKMPDGTTTAILQGRKRIKLVDELSETPVLKATFQGIAYKQPHDKL